MASHALSVYEDFFLSRGRIFWFEGNFWRLAEGYSKYVFLVHPYLTSNQNRGLGRDTWLTGEGTMSQCFVLLWLFTGSVD